MNILNFLKKMNVLIFLIMNGILFLIVYIRNNFNNIKSLNIVIDNIIYIWLSIMYIYIPYIMCIDFETITKISFIVTQGKFIWIWLLLIFIKFCCFLYIPNIIFSIYAPYLMIDLLTFSIGPIITFIIINFIIIILYYFFLKGIHCDYYDYEKKIDEHDGYLFFENKIFFFFLYIGLYIILHIGNTFNIFIIIYIYLLIIYVSIFINFINNFIFFNKINIKHKIYNYIILFLCPIFIFIIYDYKLMIRIFTFSFNPTDIFFAICLFDLILPMVFFYGCEKGYHFNKKN